MNTVGHIDKLLFQLTGTEKGRKLREGDGNKRCIKARRRDKQFKGEGQAGQRCAAASKRSWDFELAIG